MDHSSFSSRRKFMAPALLMPVMAAVPAAFGAVPAPKGKVLVAYFSRSGNTRVIAGQIHRMHDAPLFEIAPATAYPEDYLQTVEQARQETAKGFKPPLKATVADLTGVETIFLGFPIWGTTMPPVVRSFLAAHDLKGKTIIPFITHGGYGTGNSLKVLAADAPGAKLVNQGLVMQADQERKTMETVNDWLAKMKKATT
jgi:flavodoxin